MPKDIHMLVSMINMKLRLDENEYFYDESTNQIKTK